MGIKAYRAAAVNSAATELLTDPQGALLLNVGQTTFAELQQESDFPRPVWLGPRAKRHVRTELMQWALKRRQRGTIAGGA